VTCLTNPKILILFKTELVGKFVFGKKLCDAPTSPFPGINDSKYLEKKNPEK
jgi:hypothetical protein